MAEFSDRELIPERKEKKELTPEIRYVLDYTWEGKILKLVLEYLEKHPEYSRNQIAEEIAKKEKKSIKAILNRLTRMRKMGLLTIEIEKGVAKIKKVNLEKLEELWKEGRAAQILKLIEENPFISAVQIARIREDWFRPVIYNELKNLESVGLIRTIPWKGGRRFFSQSFEEKIRRGEVKGKIAKIIGESDEKIKAKIKEMEEKMKTEETKEE